MAPPPKPPKPRNDEYTQAVKEGGMAAVRDARSRRRFGSQSVGEQISENQSSTGYAGKPVYAQPARQQNDLYDEWKAQVTPVPTGQYGYGRNGGDYAGFKTEGGLKAYVRGRAESIRSEDDARFRALDEMANQRLDLAGEQYDAERAKPVNTTFYPRQVGVLEDGPQQRPTPDLASMSPAEQIGARAAEAILASRDKIDKVIPLGMPDSTSEGLNRADNAAASRYTGMAEQQARGEKMAGFIADELNPWLAETTAPLLEQQDFAQQGMITPIADYAQRAAAEVGVDPNIVGGWYPDASALSDAQDQRDLDMLGATGMDWGDTQAALAAMDAETRRANGEMEDQTMAADAAAIDEFVFSQTGMAADRLASSAGIPVTDVAGIVQSDAFQTYNNDIYQALRETDPANPDGTAVDILMGTLDAAATQDPALFNILQAVYKDFIPSDYQPLGG